MKIYSISIDFFENSRAFSQGTTTLYVQAESKTDAFMKATKFCLEQNNLTWNHSKGVTYEPINFQNVEEVKVLI